MCQQRNIKIINHTDTTDSSKHLNESLLDLNRYGAIEFANKFKNVLCNLGWRDVGNSEGLDHYEANIPGSVRNTFHCDHNEVLSENGDKVSILCSAYYYNDNNIKDDLVYINPVKVLNNIHQTRSNRLVIAQLNISSLRNKFAWLSTMIKDYDHLLSILETKIDSSFPTAQFHIDGYTIHWRDRDENGDGLLLYVREDVPSALLKRKKEMVIMLKKEMVIIRKNEKRNGYYEKRNGYYKKKNGYYVAHTTQIKLLSQNILLKLVEIENCFRLNMIIPFYRGILILNHVSNPWEISAMSIIVKRLSKAKLALKIHITLRVLTCF